VTENLAEESHPVTVEHLLDFRLAIGTPLHDFRKGLDVPISIQIRGRLLVAISTVEVGAQSDVPNTPPRERANMIHLVDGSL
jgi:hypothetical protein